MAQNLRERTISFRKEKRYDGLMVFFTTSVSMFHLAGGDVFSATTFGLAGALFAVNVYKKDVNYKRAKFIDDEAQP